MPSSFDGIGLGAGAGGGDEHAAMKSASSTDAYLNIVDFSIFDD